MRVLFLAMLVHAALEDRMVAFDGVSVDMAAIAGPYAQRRHDPSSKWRRGKDFKEARYLVYCLHQHCRIPARDRVISSFWRYTNARTDEFLESHWDGIEALAHRLIRDGTASKEEALAAGLELATLDLADSLAESLSLAGMVARIGNDLRS